MPQRITIMIDDDLAKKIRVAQASMIKETNSSVSFSKVLNQTLRKGLK